MMICHYQIDELSGEIPSTTLGQIFVQFCNFLQTFVDYANMYEKMMLLLRNKRAQNKKFKDLLDVTIIYLCIVFVCVLCVC